MGEDRDMTSDKTPPRLRAVTPREETAAERAGRLAGEADAAGRELAQEWLAAVGQSLDLANAVAATTTLPAGVRHEAELQARNMAAMASRVRSILDR